MAELLGMQVALLVPEQLMVPHCEGQPLTVQVGSPDLLGPWV